MTQLFTADLFSFERVRHHLALQTEHGIGYPVLSFGAHPIAHRQRFRAIFVPLPDGVSRWAAAVLGFKTVLIKAAVIWLRVGAIRTREIGFAGCSISQLDRSPIRIRYVP
jgi:hypothetical protein